MPTPLKALAGAVAVLALLPAAASAQVSIDPPLPDVPTVGPGRQIPPRPPKTPPPVTPVVVSVGDSAISGEAGRWAGNTKLPAGIADALGPGAYDDNASGTGEKTAGCHRSRSAEVHITAGTNGAPVESLNLSCSGAKTGSYVEPSSGNFKPGLDFYDDGRQKGQGLQLHEYAVANPRKIKAVVVLNGANEFGFSEVAGRCAQRFILSPFAFKDLCSDDPDMVEKFGPKNVEAVTQRLTIGFDLVYAAMKDAGYADGDYRIIAQTYTSPVPPSRGIRYSEIGYTRSAIGGCPIWNADADWVDTVVLNAFNRAIRNAVARSKAPNISLLDARNAFAGRRLCEDTVGLMEERGIGHWTQPGAADNTEWVKQINTWLPGPPDYQENAHPSYWGQMALRNCFRQAYNNGAPRGGTCVRGNGLNSRGEPNMSLQ
jgi:hypothetical protein